MFLELIIAGIFVAAALFNVQPARENLSAGSGVSEVKSVSEDWVEAFKSEQITHYANPATLYKSGRDRVKMWRLTDYKIAQINGDYVYLSKKYQEEYDCDIGRVRLLYSALYDGNMGKGEPLYTRSETYAWEAVALDTDTAAMWKIACGKR